MKLPVTVKTRMDLIHINAEGKVTSRNIAEVFGRQHGHVLRTIETLIEEGGESSFGLSNYLTSQGKKEKEYLLDRLLPLIFSNGLALPYNLF